VPSDSRECRKQEQTPNPNSEEKENLKNEKQTASKEENAGSKQTNPEQTPGESTNALVQK
jgi:hypothetical protein